MLLAVAGSAGCDPQAQDSWRCTENRCEMTVSGSPTLEVLDVRLKAKVTRGRVRVSGGGVDVTLNPGEAAMVEGVRVEVRSVENGSATLVVTD
ncbi:hypothetical protein [Actinokineospora sp.]|uniref:hypothetical protein n=1 Tax=Actinokineospora sp. TaxID=1872133 RepID=UPI004037A2EA